MTIRTFNVSPASDPQNVDLAVGLSGTYIVDDVTLSIVTAGGTTPSLSVRIVDNTHILDDSASIDLLTDAQPTANTAGKRTAYVESAKRKIDLGSETLRTTIAGGVGGTYQITVRLIPALPGEPDARPQLAAVLAALGAAPPSNLERYDAIGSPDPFVRRGART